MPRNRNRSAWVWVTIAAIALASVARADGNRQSTKAGMRAALALLTRGQGLPLSANPGMAQFVPRTAGRRIAMPLRSSSIGAWVGILPVFFVVMVAPPKADFAISLPRSGQIPAKPLLPCSFQRPPPQRA